MVALLVTSLFCLVKFHTSSELPLLFYTKKFAFQFFQFNIFSLIYRSPFISIYSSCQFNYWTYWVNLQLRLALFWWIPRMIFLFYNSFSINLLFPSRIRCPFFMPSIHLLIFLKCWQVIKKAPDRTVVSAFRTIVKKKFLNRIFSTSNCKRQRLDPHSETVANKPL